MELDEFLEKLAMARYAEEIEKNILASAISEVFANEE